MKKIALIFILIPVFAHSQSKWVIGVTYTSAFSQVHAKANVASNSYSYGYSDYQNLVRHLNESKPLFDFSGGVNLGYKVSNHFTLMSGLWYTSLGYKVDSLGYSYSYPNIVVNYTDTKTKLKAYSVEIPLLFIYKLNFNKCSFFLSGGAILGESIKYRRKTYFGQDAPSWLEPKVDKYFQGGPFHADLSAGFGIAVKISEKGSLVFEPNFRFNLFNSNDKKFGIIQRVSTYGLKLSYFKNF
jgi:Outer membrane protein beta-barrel domain